MLPPGASPPWHFDVRHFGQEVRARRQSLGYSTRRLAERAGVSQAYVVALERSTSSRDRTGPCPSVDVLVGLASALQLHPVELLSGSLLAAGSHILYVVDGAGREIFDTARAQVPDADVWVSAGRRRGPSRTVPHLSIHPEGEADYRAEGVTAVIRSGFAGLAPVVYGRHVGVVFSDEDSTLLGARDRLLSIERDWQSIVSSAAWAADAATATAVCVYELDVLQRMEPTLETALDLIASHDTVVLSDGRTVSRGRSASLRVLHRLRPAHTRADEWRRSCARRLDEVVTAGAQSPHRHA